MSMRLANTEKPVLDAGTMVSEMLRPLQQILDQSALQELTLNQAGEVFCLGSDGWVRHDVPELSIERLMTLCLAVATFTGQSLTRQTPLLSAVLPGGERIQIAIPPAVEDSLVSISVRRPGTHIKPLELWVREGAFDEMEARSDPENKAHSLCLGPIANVSSWLNTAVVRGQNIAIVGETGSGKTTLMKSLCQLIPTHERLITIEDVRELHLPMHQNRVHLLYSRGGQGMSKVGPGELITACLRMRPDRVLLAELRGSEAFDYLKLLSTGHRGSITSFHAGSCAQAFDRFTLMCRENADAVSYANDELVRLVRLNLDIILHLTAERDAAGKLRRRYVQDVWRREGAGI